MEQQPNTRKINTDLIRKRIKSLRIAKGYSLSDMAQKLSMDERNYQRIESGEKKSMLVDEVFSIADILDADFIDLLQSGIVYNTSEGNSVESASHGVGIANTIETLTVNNTNSEETVKMFETFLAAAKHNGEEKNHIISQQKAIIERMEGLLEKFSGRITN